MSEKSYCFRTIRRNTAVWGTGDDKDVSDQELNLKLDNFYDEAYIMIRMNEGTPGNIEGGELTHITGNLYLLRAKEKSVKIEIR